VLPHLGKNATIAAAGMVPACSNCERIVSHTGVFAERDAAVLRRG